MATGFRWMQADSYLQTILTRCLHAQLSKAAARFTEKTPRLVDMGCGSRPYESLVRGLNLTYLGADIGQNPGADLALHEGSPVAAEAGSAVIVLSTQVLEHVGDLDWYFAECYRLLPPGGTLLLSTHGFWPYHPHPTDFRRWTKSGLELEISKRGFAIVSTTALMGPGAWMLQFILLFVWKFSRRWPAFIRAFLTPFFVAGNAIMALMDSITPAAVHDDNAAVYVVSAKRPTPDTLLC